MRILLIVINSSVALSRIRSIEKMFLVGNYSRAEIKVNLIAAKKYAGLQKESQLQAISVKQIKENLLTVTLLNTIL